MGPVDGSVRMTGPVRRVLSVVRCFVLTCLLATRLGHAATVLEMAQTYGAHTFIQNVELAGLRETLDGEGPFTLFVPTDEAFAAMLHPLKQALQNRTDTLNDALLYHVIEGYLKANDMTNDQLITSLEGSSIRINIYTLDDPTAGVAGDIDSLNPLLTDSRNPLLDLPADELDIDDLPIINPSNGEHRDESDIDGISMANNDPGSDQHSAGATRHRRSEQTATALTTPSTEHRPNSPVAGVTHHPDMHLAAAHGDEGTTSPNPSQHTATLWPSHPNNNLGTFRVLTATGKRVIHPDILADNGVIHIVSRVLRIPVGTVLDAIVQNSDMDTTANAIKTADMQSIFYGTGPFTVFVPNNEAWTNLTPEEQSLIFHDHDLLQTVLNYHVVPGTFYVSGFEDEMVFSTLNSTQHLNLMKDYDTPFSDQVLINARAKLVQTDLTVTNGVIHVIDKVLIPIDARLEKSASSRLHGDGLLHVKLLLLAAAARWLFYKA